MGKKYAIYSLNESIANDGCGYWSNEFGWTDEEHATLFTLNEVGKFSLPISMNEDAHWVEMPVSLRVVMVINDGLFDHAISNTPCKLVILDYEGTEGANDIAAIPQGDPEDDYTVNAAFVIAETAQTSKERLDEIFSAIENAIAVD